MHYIKGLPPSKSYVNRLLIMAALADNLEEVLELFDSQWSLSSQAEDILLMRSALLLYRNTLKEDSKGNQESLQINVGAGGTVLRFLVSLFALKTKRNITFIAEERLQERPLSPLIRVLRSMGATIEGEWAKEEASLMEIGPPKTSLKGIVVDESIGTLSSQFISSLLLIAPYLSSPLSIKLTDDLPSRPYIDLSLFLMEQAGATIRKEGDLFTIMNTPYKRECLEHLAVSVEGDWSAASYIYAWVACSSQNIRISIPSLSNADRQGDKKLVAIMESLGVQTEFLPNGGIIIEKEKSRLLPSLFAPDLRDMPDLLPALFVIALMKDVPFNFSNVGHLRLKESDRLSALTRIARSMGFWIEETESSVSWRGKRDVGVKDVFICTERDHRLAMSWSLAELLGWKISFDDFSVIQKSYPLYKEDFESLVDFITKEKE